MKKELWSPFLNIIAMLLIIISRLEIESGIGWIGYTAAILILASLVYIINLSKKT